MEREQEQEQEREQEREQEQELEQERELELELELEQEQERERELELEQEQEQERERELEQERELERPMTRLEAIRARLAAATPGPWAGVRGMFDGDKWIKIRSMSVREKHTLTPEDADLIAHAPDDLALLVEVVDSLFKALHEYERESNTVAPDYALRRLRRDQLFKVFASAKEKLGHAPGEGIEK